MVTKLLAAPDVAVYVKANDQGQIANQLEKTLHWARHNGLGWLTVDRITQAQANANIGERIVIEPGRGTSSNDSIHVVVDPVDGDGGLRALKDTLEPDKDVHAEFVVTRVDALIQSPDQIRDLAYYLEQYSVTIHVTEQKVSLHPGRGMPRSVLRLLWEDANTEDDDDRDAEDTPSEEAPLGPNETGQPPLGLTSRDGFLYPGEKYEDVCRQLQGIVDGEQSKRAAAAALGTSRQTLRNALDRPAMYNLDVE